MIAVRPEKITLNGAGTASAAAGNRLEGKLTQAVYSGMSTTYKVDVQGREVTVFDQNKGAPSLTPGTAVRLEWTPDHSVVVQP